jgi:HK97 gp10 family phage protein
MKVEVKILNIEELKKVMKEKQDALKDALPEGIRDATIMVHGQVKESISRGTNAPVTVDTGRFLNSVDFDTAGNDGVVFSDLDYAKFLEFGTSKMEARPHFRNTAFVLADGIKQILKNEVKNAVE